jgi:hypothetical protein
MRHRSAVSLFVLFDLNEPWSDPPGGDTPATGGCLRDDGFVLGMSTGRRPAADWKL